MNPIVMDRQGEIQISQDPTLDIIREHLSTNYFNLQPFREGGTRKVFLVDWGPKGKKRVVKVDKKPSTPHAARNVGRGYNTQREVMVASGIDDPEEHHLIRIYDYLKVPEFRGLGFSEIASIEGYFPGETLEDRIRERGPFTGVQAGQLFAGVLDAVKYLHNDQGLFHRDLNRKNILVKENGKVDARVTDLANACSISEVTAKPRPTSGSRFVLDPTIEQVFTGQATSYNAGSEIYMVGKNMLYALTEEDAVRYNPDTGEAVNIFTGESLLTEGIVDPKKHNAAIDKALGRIPKDGKRYVPFLKRALTLDQEKRYASIDACVADFEKASRPTLWERIKKNKTLVGGLAAGVLGIAGILGGYSIYQEHKNQQLQVELEQSLRYPVAGEWDGTTLEVSNGLTNLEVKAHNNKDWKHRYPEDVKYLQVKSGDTLWADILATEIARPKDSIYHGNPQLVGKAYIEGYEGTYFSIWPGPIDKTDLDGSMHSEGIGWIWRMIPIPKDVPEGNYTLAFELYARENSKNEGGGIRTSEESINFKEPGKVLARKRIPLVVGNIKDEDKVQLHNVSFSGWVSGGNLGIRRVDSLYGDIDPKLVYQFSVPELDTSWTSKSERTFHSSQFDEYLHLPQDTSGLIRTLQVVARDPKTDRVISTGYLPLKMEHQYGTYYAWDLAKPDSTWSNRLIAYRKALQGDSTGLYDIREQLRSSRLAEEEAQRLEKRKAYVRDSTNQADIANALKLIGH